MQFTALRSLTRSCMTAYCISVIAVEEKEEKAFTVSGAVVTHFVNCAHTCQR